MSNPIPTMPEFTPDFSGQSKYSPDYKFSSVIFPTNAPLLAEDLNEAQLILGNMIKSLSETLLTDGVISSTGASWYTTGGVSIAGGDMLLIIADGKILSIKGPVSIDSKSVWCKFRKVVVTAESGEIEGLPNYLADNAFGMELSRREKFLFDGLSSNETVGDGQFAVKILDYEKPVYAKVKVDSNQGDTLKNDLALVFNGFTSGSVVWGTTADGLEQVTETQKDISGKLIATKVTVFNSDQLITETLTIAGGKTYVKKTTFSVDAGGNDVINTQYNIL